MAKIRTDPTRTRSRSGGGAFSTGAVTDLYSKNLIALFLESSSLLLSSSDFSLGFNTGFSSSGGNIQAG